MYIYIYIYIYTFQSRGSSCEMASQWRAGKCDATGVATHGWVDRDHAVFRICVSAVAVLNRIRFLLTNETRYRCRTTRDHAWSRVVTVLRVNDCDSSVATIVRPCRRRHIARCCVRTNLWRSRPRVFLVWCCTLRRQSLSTMEFFGSRFFRVHASSRRFCIRRSCIAASKDDRRGNIMELAVIKKHDRFAAAAVSNHMEH